MLLHECQNRSYISRPEKSARSASRRSGVECLLAGFNPQPLFCLWCKGFLRLIVLLDEGALADW